MSKKIFITIFFTIICLFFTNHYWFDYKPVPIAFNIFGDGEWIIRTYLLNPDNNIDTDPFKTVSMHKSIINTNKKKKYFATIKVNKKIEYIRINFTKKTPVSKDETLVIQPVWFNRVKLGELEKYKTENAELITEDCGLVLIPQQELFSLVYDANINFIPHKQLNFILFALILIFAIIFSYKFSGYIIEFKTKKTEEVIFVLIFFVLLLIPTYNISKEEFSIQENRGLASDIMLFDKKTKTINKEIGKQFNDWFNDRFYLRTKLIHLPRLIQEKLSLFYVKLPNGLIDKKNKTLYKTFEIKKYNIDELNKIFQTLQLINDFCNKNNIKLYMLIVPDQSDVYPALNISKDYKNLKNAIKASNLHIIFPIQAMQEQSKSDYVFFKTEHHWTDDGAYIGYKSLMEGIKKDFPDVKILNNDDFEYFYNTKVRSDFERDFHYGATCKVLGLTESSCAKYHDVLYKYYKHRDYNNLNIKAKVTPYQRNKVYYYPKGTDLNVVIIGTSQIENLFEFIPFTFKNVLQIRTNRIEEFPPKEEFKIMKHYKKQIFEFKPDIMVLCFTYTNLKQLENFFVME